MNHFVQQQMSILRNYIDILRNTYYGFVIRLTRQVSLVEQELLTLPKHLSLPPVFSEVRVTRSLVLYIYKGVDVVEWSRALDVRLSEWCCSVSMVWVQIPSREEQKFDSSKI